MRDAGGVRIKLCGMFCEDDIDAVNEVRPDFVGFVIDFPKSHRSLFAERAVELASRVSDGIARVGVFVNEPVEAVAHLHRAGAIDIVQLHGTEDAGYLARLRAQVDTTIIQAFRICVGDDVARAQASEADYVLLDSGQGTGQTFDWSLLQGMQRPFMLAGGLGPNNVTDAIRAVRPWAVDMSSGIETNGRKDPQKMRAAVAAVRNLGERPDGLSPTTYGTDGRQYE